MHEVGARTTLARPVGLTGVGLHSGDAVRLRLLPAAAGAGLVVRRVGASGTVDVEASLAHVVDDRNATTLGRAGARVSTVEHVLAALAALAIDDALIELDADEPPAGDGSAAPFVGLVERAGRRRQAGARRVARVVAPLSVVDGERRIEIEPADALSVDYTIDFEAPAVGRQSIRLEPLDAAVFRREIAAARTFGFLADVEALRAAGLARGASLGNTVVIDGSRVVNPDGLRWPDECVRHKVLDLLGDLALFRHPLVGLVRVHHGGHALHHALLRHLAETPDAWRLEDARPPA